MKKQLSILKCVAYLFAYTEVSVCLYMIGVKWFYEVFNSETLVVVTAVLFQCADNHSQSTSTHQFSKHYVQQQSRYLMSKLSVGGEDMWFSERTICLTQRRECGNRVLELNYFIEINAMFDKWKMTNETCAIQISG